MTLEELAEKMDRRFDQVASDMDRRFDQSRMDSEKAHREIGVKLDLVLRSVRNLEDRLLAPSERILK